MYLFSVGDKSSYFLLCLVGFFYLLLEFVADTFACREELFKIQRTKPQWKCVADRVGLCSFYVLFLLDFSLDDLLTDLFTFISLLRGVYFSPPSAPSPLGLIVYLKL